MTLGDPALELLMLDEAILTEGPVACRMVAEKIAALAQIKAPKDTERLMESIVVDPSGNDTKISFGGGDAYYGLFMEYGTIKQINGWGYLGNLPQLEGYTKANSYAFMRPAIDEIVNSDQAINLISGMIRNKWAQTSVASKIARMAGGGFVSSLGAAAIGAGSLSKINSNPVSTGSSADQKYRDMIGGGGMI